MSNDISRGIVTSKLNRRGIKAKGITHSAMAKEAARRAFPAIYIESQESISVVNNGISVSSTHFNTSNKSMIEVVAFLRSNGVDAWLTSPDLSGYPAALIRDFSSVSRKPIDIRVSPFRITDHHTEFVNNLIEFDEDSVVRNIHPEAGITATQDGDLVYVGGEFSSEEPARCILEYKVVKYVLMAGSGSVSNGYEFLTSQLDNNHEAIDLLMAINAENRNRI